MFVLYKNLMHLLGKHNILHNFTLIIVSDRLVKIVK